MRHRRLKGYCMCVGVKIQIFDNKTSNSSVFKSSCSILGYQIYKGLHKNYRIGPTFIYMLYSCVKYKSCKGW